VWEPLSDRSISRAAPIDKPGGARVIVDHDIDPPSFSRNALKDMEPDGEGHHRYQWAFDRHHIDEQVHADADIHVETQRLLFDRLAREVLSFRERGILEDRMAGMTLSEAGAERRISGERTRQIEEAAIKKVQRATSLPPARKRRKWPTDVNRLAERYLNHPTRVRAKLVPPGERWIFDVETDFESWILGRVKAFPDATPEECRRAWRIAEGLPEVWRERAKRREVKKS
jgi:hypothetical protein